MKCAPLGAQPHTLAQIVAPSVRLGGTRSVSKSRPPAPGQHPLVGAKGRAHHENPPQDCPGKRRSQFKC